MPPVRGIPCTSLPADPTAPTQPAYPPRYLPEPISTRRRRRGRARSLIVWQIVDEVFNQPLMDFRYRSRGSARVAAELLHLAWLVQLARSGTAAARREGPR